MERRGKVGSVAVIKWLIDDWQEAICVQMAELLYLVNISVKSDNLEAFREGLNQGYTQLAETNSANYHLIRQFIA